MRICNVIAKIIFKFRYFVCGYRFFLKSTVTCESIYLYDGAYHVLLESTIFDRYYLPNVADGRIEIIHSATGLFFYIYVDITVLNNIEYDIYLLNFIGEFDGVGSDDIITYEGKITLTKAPYLTYDEWLITKFTGDDDGR